MFCYFAALFNCFFLFFPQINAALIAIMVRPVKRRSTPVITAIQLLDAVIYIRQQKQIPNLERLYRYMHRWHDISEKDTEKHINNAVTDGFIISYTAVGTKGSKIGSEQEGFRVPDDNEKNEVT